MAQGWRAALSNPGTRISPVMIALGFAMLFRHEARTECATAVRKIAALRCRMAKVFHCHWQSSKVFARDNKYAFVSRKRRIRFEVHFHATEGFIVRVPAICGPLGEKLVRPLALHKCDLGVRRIEFLRDIGARRNGE